MPWIEDVISLLEAGSVGSYGSTIFKTSKASVPAGDGPFTSVTETGGSGTEETHNEVTDPAYHMPGAQVLVRGKDVAATRAKARAAYRALRITNRTVNSVWYRKIRALHEPRDLGLDPQGRIQFVVNVVGDKSFS